MKQNNEVKRVRVTDIITEKDIMKKNFLYLENKRDDMDNWFVNKDEMISQTVNSAMAELEEFTDELFRQIDWGKIERNDKVSPLYWTGVLYNKVIADKIY